LGVRKLLVLDDDPTYRAFVEAIASDRGYQVRAIKAARDLDEAVASFSPDVILIDMIMPDADGIEVVKRLTAQSVEARLVLASGFDPVNLRAAQALAASAGITDVRLLEKSGGPDALMIALD